MTDAASSPARTAEVPADVRRLRRAAGLVLGLVAVWGAVLSWRSLYRAAVPVFGDRLAVGFPLLVDLLILGASLMFVAGAKLARANPGWRLLTHAGVAGTLALNAMASPDLAGIPWHVTAPAVWSVLVELTAREVIGDYKAAHKGDDSGRIPFRLWLTAPVESFTTSLRAARQSGHAQHRLDVGRHAAASEAVRVVTGGRVSARRVRWIARRQLRAGSLPPASVLGAVGWLDHGAAPIARDPEAVLRMLLASAAESPAARPRVSQVPTASHTPGVTRDSAWDMPSAGTSVGQGEAPPETAPSRPSAPRPEPAPAPAPEAPAPAPAPATEPAPEAPAPAPAPATEPAPVRTVVRPQARPAGHSKARPGGAKALALAALAETGGDAPAALRLLSDRGTPVGKSTLFEVARGLRTGLHSGPDSTPVAGPDSTLDRTPDSGPDSIPAGSDSTPESGPDSTPESGPDSTPAAGLHSGRAPERSGEGSGLDSNAIPESADLDFSDRTAGSDTGSDGARRRSGAGSDTGSDTRRRRSGTAVASAPEPAADAPEGSDSIDLTDQSPRLVAVR